MNFELTAHVFAGCKISVLSLLCREKMTVAELVDTLTRCDVGTSTNRDAAVYLVVTRKLGAIRLYVGSTKTLHSRICHHENSILREKAGTNEGDRGQ